MSALKELREELLAISEGRRSFSIKGVRGCQLLLSKSEETVKVAERLAEPVKRYGQGASERLLPDWRLLPPLP